MPIQIERSLEPEMLWTPSECRELVIFTAAIERSAGMHLDSNSLITASGSADRLLGGGRFSPLSRISLQDPTAKLLDNEKKVHPMNPEKPEANVRDYCDDFAFQAIQVLFQFALVGCHAEIESVHPVFHFPRVLP